MTVLARLLVRRNLFLLAVVAGIGLGGALFVEVFDRLDDFLEAQVPVRSLGFYVLCRAPFLLAQILPGAVLVATAVQLTLMARARELVALRAAAIAPWRWERIMLLWAMALGVAHLALAQGVGVAGHREAERIWNEEVRGRRLVSRALTDVWFREGQVIVWVRRLLPAAGVGEGVQVFLLDAAGQPVRLLHAEAVDAQPGAWRLSRVRSVEVAGLTQEEQATLVLPVALDPRSFLTMDPKASLESVPLWRLQEEIGRLRGSGASVERLETAWHMKFAQSAAVPVMAVVALGVAGWVASPYAAVTLGLVLSFAYYGLVVAFSSAAQQGLLPPAVGAWMANAVVAALAAVVAAVRRLREEG